MKVREGNEETVHYFHTEEELAQFGARQSGPGLVRGRGDVDPAHREDAGMALRAARRHVELHESKAMAEFLTKLVAEGAERRALFRAGQALCSS